MGRWLVLGLIAGCGSHPGAAGTGDAAPGGSAVVDGADAATATMIRVTLNNRPEHAAAFDFVVAFEDGDGPWQLATAPNGDTYSFTTFSPTWSIAWTCTSEVTGHYRHEVALATFTRAERTILSLDVPPRCTDRLPPVLAMSGAISNAPAGTGVLYINLADLRGAGGDAYTLQARLGVHDLVVRKLDQNNEAATFTTLDTFLERDLSVASSQHDLDLATAAATHAFDVSIPDGATALATTVFYTKSGTAVTLGRTATPLQIIGLDASQVEPTDVYDQQVELDGSGTAAITTYATLTPGPLTVPPSPPLGASISAVVAQVPYPRLQTSWPTYPDAVGYTLVAAQGPDPDTGDGWTRTWTALVSPGAAGSSPMHTMPDLSSLAGWDPGFGFQSGVQIEGYAEANTSSAGASDFPSVTPPAAGTQRTFVRSAFTVTP